jgi:hypothetical protein
VAVIAVIAIVASIVLALMVFRHREPGTVNLTTDPDSVAVSVDGRALGTSGSPFVIDELSPGRRHDIVVSSPGFHAWSHSVELSAGQVLSLPPVKLQRIETGFMLSTEPSGALVLLDGTALPQRTPVRVVDLAPGEHRLRVEHDGFAPWETVLHASTGTILPLPNVSLQPEVAGLVEPPSGSSSSKPSKSAALGTSADLALPGAPAAPRKADKPEPSAPAPEPVLAEAASKEPKPAPPPPAATAEPAPEPPAPQVPPGTEPNPYRDSAPSEPAAAPAADSGKLRVNSRPWSKIFIDGKPYGTTPRMNIELPAGSHVVKLVNDEFKVEKNLEVNITAGQVESVVVNLLE